MEPLFNTGMDDWFRSVTEQQTAALETAVEMAIQTGHSGVSVWRWIEGTTAKFEAIVDITVPYGQIYEAPFGEKPPGDAE